MKNIKKINLSAFNIISIIAFVVTYGLCALFGWFDVVNGLFDPTGSNVGEVFKMPPTYTIVCFLFMAILCVLAILGLFFKSKTMVLIAAVYELLFILSFVFLGVIATGDIANKTLYDIVLYFMTAVLIPLYGVIWNMNLLFFTVFIPLIIVTIVGVIKSFKKK